MFLDYHQTSQKSVPSFVGLCTLEFHQASSYIAGTGEPQHLYLALWEHRILIEQEPHSKCKCWLNEHCLYMSSALSLSYIPVPLGSRIRQSPKPTLGDCSQNFVHVG